MPLAPDPRYLPGTPALFASDVIEGAMARQEPSAPSPPLLDTLAAGARQMLPGAAYERIIANPDPDLGDAPPDFDPLEHIGGFESQASEFVFADSPGAVEGIKRRLRTRAEDLETLARAGLGSSAAAFGLQVLDPTFLVSAAVPEIAVGRAIRAARLAAAARGGAEGVAGAAAYEAGMQALQDGRTARESAFTIAGGALLGGVLGSVLTRVPKAERAPLREAIDAEIRSEAGAAAVMRPTTLEAESFAPGVQTLAKVSAQTPMVGTDLAKIMQSQSVQARLALQELADVAPILNKNLDDVAAPVSVENAVLRREGAVADFADELNRQYVAYRSRVAPAKPLTRAEFERLVATAARSSDTSPITEVAAAARALRERVFDPLKVEAQRLGLLPKEPQVVGAESYFRRMYDRRAIRANRRIWDRILTKHFFRQSGSLPEARAAAEDVTRTILGGDVGQANFNVRAFVPEAGPLRDRVLTIDDALIEPFLVNDPVKVARAYVRDLAPQIELTERFGDREGRDLLQRVRDDYDVLRERIRVQDLTQTASEGLSKLEAEERETLSAIVRIRDRILGRAGRLSGETTPGARRVIEAARGWRNIVASARMGGVALTGGVADLFKIISTYGYLPTFQRLTQLLAKPEFRALSKAQARRLSAATEVALSRRVHTAADGAVTEGWTQALAEGVYRYSGLNHLTDFYRTLSASLFEDAVLQAAETVASGRALPKFHAARLASLGLDSDALRAIHREVAEHGAEVDGIRMSGSATWADVTLADRYDAAILKESRIQVMEPGAADRVWWMDSETGRVIGQIKSFAFAAPLKLGFAALQAAGTGNALQAARMIGVLMIGGYLGHAFRQLAAGKLPTTDPVAAAGEAFTESGLGGVAPDLLAPIGRRLGFMESARFSDSNVMGTLLGPSVGYAQDAAQWLFVNSRNGVSAGDLQMGRRLLPYQNLWWLRRAINAVQGEIAEALELKGHDVATFGERLTRTEALRPAGERGMTGTGFVPN